MPNSTFVTVENPTCSRQRQALPAELRRVHYQLRASVATMEALDELFRGLQEELRAETNTKIITRTLRAG